MIVSPLINTTDETVPDLLAFGHNKQIPIAQFYSWSEEFKKLGGQAKIPRVMKEEDFNEFRNYVQQLS